MTYWGEYSLFPSDKKKEACALLMPRQGPQEPAEQDRKVEPPNGSAVQLSLEATDSCRTHSHDS